MENIVVRGQHERIHLTGITMLLDCLYIVKLTSSERKTKRMMNKPKDGMIKFKFTLKAFYQI